MIIDYDALEGEWFPFFESRIDARTGEIEYSDPKPDAARVRIRSFAPFIEKLEAGRKQKVERVLNTKTRSMERITYYEEPSREQLMKEMDDATDYAITGLEGFYDKNKKEIECTRENKLKLMKIPVFNRFFSRCIQILSDSGIIISEEQEKNV